VLHIPFVAPVNESASKQVSPPGTVIMQRNQRLRPNGSYRKVLSPSVLGTQIINPPGDTSTITQVRGSIDGDFAQVVTAKTSIGDHHAYQVDGANLTQLGKVSPFIPSFYRRLAAGMGHGDPALMGNKATTGDFVSLNGIDAFVVVDSDRTSSVPESIGYVRTLHAVNATNGKLVATVTYVTPTVEASGARVIAVGNVIMAFMASFSGPTQIYLWTLDTTLPAPTWVNRFAQMIGSTLLSSYPPVWDVVPYDSTRAVGICLSAAANEARLRFIFNDGTAPGVETVFSTVGNSSLRVDARSDLGVVAVVGDNGAAINSAQVYWFNSALAPTGNKPAVNIAALRDVRIVIEDASNVVLLVSGDSSSVNGTWSTQVRRVHITSGQAGTLPTIGGVRPLGRPFFFGGQLYSFFVRTLSWKAAGGTLLLMRLTRDVTVLTDHQLVLSHAYTTVFTESAATASSVTIDSTRGILIGIPVVTSPLWQYLASKTNAADIGHAFDVFGVKEIDSNSSGDIKIPQMCQARDGIVIPSANTAVVYPNASVREMGFPGEPDILLSHTAALGGLTTLGVYYYSAWYEWDDPNGRTVRGPVGYPQPIVLSGAENAAVVNTGSLQYLQKSQQLVNSPRMMFARTTNSGQVFYAVTTDARSVPLRAGNASWVDVLSDVNITSRATLYTEGGVLSDDPPPPGSLAAFGAGRLWIAGQFDTQKITASKLLDERYGIAFSVAPEFSFAVGEPVTALWVMDGALVIFTADTIYIQTGEGPDARGQGRFPQPRRLPSSVGCVTHRSLVEVPDGLIFYHRDAFYLLPRGFGAPQRISDAIAESSRGLNIMSGVATQDEDGRGVVMFFPSQDTSADYLMMDLQSGAWTIGANSNAIAHASRAAPFVSGLSLTGATRLSSWGIAGQLDLPSACEFTALRPNGVLGDAQIRAIALLVEYVGDAIITTEADVDGEWVELDEFELSARYGAVPGKLQRRVVEVSDELRDLEAITLRIRDRVPTGTAYTQGPVYHGLSVEYAARDSLALVEKRDHV
jgi:hypothetical protein